MLPSVFPPAPSTRMWTTPPTRGMQASCRREHVFLSGGWRLCRTATSFPAPGHYVRRGPSPILAMRVGAVLLASGAGRRFGSNKLLADWLGRR